MKYHFARFGSRLPVASIVVVLLSLATAHAEDALSERLTDQIWEMNKLDIIHKLDGELDRRKSALTQQATVERANNLRKLLKARAGVYETLDDFDRAEVEYKNFVDPMVYIDRGYSTCARADWMPRCAIS